MAMYLRNSHCYREPAEEFDEDDGDKAVVLLDLETSGLHMNCEILQIAAVCHGTEPFSVYIKPIRDIPERVTEVNGLSTYRGQLMLDGVPVPTVPMSTALKRLQNWLRSIGQNCFIATHNLSFDGPRLLKAFTEHSSRNKFAQVVHGFIDTLRVIRNVTDWKGQCKLVELADRYNISTSGAHNAVYDCEMLQKVLCKLNVTKSMLLKNSKGFTQQIQHWDTLERNRKTLETLAPLRCEIGSTDLKKLARAGIDMQSLETCYEETGASGVVEYLLDKFFEGTLEKISDTTLQKIAMTVSYYCNTAW